VLLVNVCHNIDDTLSQGHFAGVCIYNNIFLKKWKKKKKLAPTGRGCYEKPSNKVFTDLEERSFFFSRWGAKSSTDEERPTPGSNPGGQLVTSRSAVPIHHHAPGSGILPLLRMI
jgi:hypothetical protein